MKAEKKYLLINLYDLSSLGTVGPLGSPLNLMVRPELGDTLNTNTTIYKGPNADDEFVIFESSQERCLAVQAGLELIGKRKIGRKIRTFLRSRLGRATE